VIKIGDIDWTAVARALGVAAPAADPPGMEPILPANLQAEQALLGAILANNAAYDRVAPFLAPEHFADPIHARIYQAVQRRIANGQTADAVTLKMEFEHAGILDEVGGTAYLAQLLTAMVGIINASEYGRTVHDAWMRRQAVVAGLGIVEAAIAPGPDRAYREVLVEGVNAMLDLQGAASTTDRARTGTLGSAVAAVMEAAEREHKAEPAHGAGFYTGIESLDAIWPGMWPGRMTMLAGRSGHGKTALGTQIMRHVSGTLLAAVQRTKDKLGRVQMFSLEMSRTDIAARMLSWESGVATDDIIGGKLTGDRTFALLEAQKAIDQLPIDIHDATGMTAQDIVAEATAAVRRNNVKLIVIDHLHRIVAPPGRRIDTSQVVLGAAKAMKDLARALDVHVLLLAQIASRSADRGGSDDPRPRMSQIGYGGETEADDVLLVWREELHMGKEPPEVKGAPAAQANAKSAWLAKLEQVRGRAEVILPKRRFGAMGAVPLKFDATRGRFSDLPADPQFGHMPGLWDEIPPNWGGAA
jgi:replicative DNA helicase